MVAITKLSLDSNHSIWIHSRLLNDTPSALRLGDLKLGASPDVIHRRAHGPGKYCPTLNASYLIIHLLCALFASSYFIFNPMATENIEKGDQGTYLYAIGRLFSLLGRQL
jgi:hypothetical protein